MGTIKAGAVAKGAYIMERNEPYVVREHEFVKPGKGLAFVRLKLKNLRNGTVLRVTHKSQDNCEEIDIEEIEAQFLYSDETSFHFMDSITFEQFEVPMPSHEKAQYYMLAGEIFKLTRWNGETLDIRLPPQKRFVSDRRGECCTGRYGDRGHKIRFNRDKPKSQGSDFYQKRRENTSQC